MIEMVSVMEVSYETALSYWKKVDNGKLRQTNKGFAMNERSWPHVVRVEITIKMDEMPQNADESVVEA